MKRDASASSDDASMGSSVLCDSLCGGDEAVYGVDDASQEIRTDCPGAFSQAALCADPMGSLRAAMALPGMRDHEVPWLRRCQRHPRIRDGHEGLKRFAEKIP